MPFKPVVFALSWLGKKRGKSAEHADVQRRGGCFGCHAATVGLPFFSVLSLFSPLVVRAKKTPRYVEALPLR